MIDIFYNIWAILMAYSAWKVINAKSPISSIFWLILTFVFAVFLLLLLGIEFLPILFIIVYVGAIAILFLFVIMLLNIKFVELYSNAYSYIPISIIVGAIFLTNIINLFPNYIDNFTPIQDYSIIFNNNNIKLLGNILYTEYWIYFIVSSFILFVAMIGAILLCLFHENTVKRQDLFAQVATEYDKTVINVK